MNINKKCSEFCKQLIYFVIFGILSYIIDISTAQDGLYDNCKNVSAANVNLIIHHIINIFAQFGWISNNKYILILYLVAPIIAIIHWKTNNNQCVLTQKLNENCNLSKNQMFRDIFDLIGIKKMKYYTQLHYFYLIIAWFIALYKIFRK